MQYQYTTQIREPVLKLVMGIKSGFLDFEIQDLGL